MSSLDESESDSAESDVDGVGGLDSYTNETKKNIELLKTDGLQVTDANLILKNQSARLFTSDPIEWSAYKLNMRKYLSKLSEEELKSIIPADNTIYYGLINHCYYSAYRYRSEFLTGNVSTYTETNKICSKIHRHEISYLEIYDADQILNIIHLFNDTGPYIHRLKLNPGSFRIVKDKYSLAVSLIIEKGSRIKDLEIWENPLFHAKLISLDMRNMLYIKNPSDLILRKALKLYPKIVAFIYRKRRYYRHIYERLQELKDDSN